MTCLSCGYLVDETPTYILLALNQQEKRDYRKQMVGDTIQIPLVAVTAIRELRLARVRRTREAAPKRRR